MRKKLTCPFCHEEFNFGFRKNAFSNKLTCPHCGKQLYVENKTFPYLIMAFVLYLCSYDMLNLIKSFGFSNFFTYALEFLFLMVVYFLLFTLTKFIFGPKLLYRVKDGEEMIRQRASVDEMRKEMKKKKQEKK